MDKRGRHRRIAIVDDEAALREAAKNLLKAEGYGSAQANHDAFAHILR
jgi:FixJ family two-component response regulator